MRLSNSKAAKFRRCPKAYEFGYVHKLKPKLKKLPLERGSWLHSLLEVHYADDPNKVIEVKKKKYRVGNDWRKAHKVYTKWFKSLFEEERADLGEDLPNECERIMVSYLARYEREDEGEVTLATELDEWVTLPNGDEFNFIIDRVVQRPDGSVWLKDYKTVGTFMPEGFMLIDAQLARYFWAFKRLPDFAHLAGKLRGVEFDELRTKAPTVPEVVYKGKPNEGLTQRSNLDTDYATYVKAITDNGYKKSDYRDVLTRLRAQEDRFFRRTILAKDGPVVKQMMVDLMVTAADIKRHERSGHFPRTPDKSCTWGCDFYELCTVELHGGDIEQLVGLKYDRKEDK